MTNGRIAPRDSYTPSLPIVIDPDAPFPQTSIVRNRRIHCACPRCESDVIDYRPPPDQYIYVLYTEPARKGTLHRTGVGKIFAYCSWTEIPFFGDDKADICGIPRSKRSKMTYIMINRAMRRRQVGDALPIVSHDMYVFMYEQVFCWVHGQGSHERARPIYVYAMSQNDL